MGTEAIPAVSAANTELNGLRVVTDKSRINVSEGKADIVIRTETFKQEERANLIGEDSSDLALKYAAANGLPNAGFTSVFKSPYPVDRLGNVCRTPSQRPDHWRCDFQLGRLGVF